MNKNLENSIIIELSDDGVAFAMIKSDGALNLMNLITVFSASLKEKGVPDEIVDLCISKGRKLSNEPNDEIEKIDVNKTFIDKFKNKLYSIMTDIESTPEEDEKNLENLILNTMNELSKRADKSSTSQEEEKHTNSSSEKVIELKNIKSKNNDYLN